MLGKRGNVLLYFSWDEKQISVLILVQLLTHIVEAPNSWEVRGQMMRNFIRTMTPVCWVSSIRLNSETRCPLVQLIHFQCAASRMRSEKGEKRTKRTNKKVNVKVGKTGRQSRKRLNPYWSRKQNQTHLTFKIQTFVRLQMVAKIDLADVLIKKIRQLSHKIYDIEIIAMR